MSIMIDEFDDDNELEVASEDPDVAYIKNTVKNGLLDLEKICDLLKQLLPLAEPFDDGEHELESLLIYYGEVLPRILIGDFDELCEGLTDAEAEMAQVAFKHTRKAVFSNLAEKYN